MKRKDSQLGTPFTEYIGTKADVEAFPSPNVGMVAVATDNPTAPFGTYNGSSWIWGGGGTGASGTSDHEALTGLLGGSSNNHWHLMPSQIIGLVSGTSTALHSHAGGGGTVDSVVAGDNIDVDATDPANPVVSFTPQGSEADYLIYHNGAWENTPVPADTFDPSGWLSAQIWNKATVAVADTTKLKITLSATANIEYYWRGHKVSFGATSKAIKSTEDKSEGIWYCYSTDGTNFILTKTPFYIFDMISGAIRADLMVWEFYWDNTNNVTLWIQPEYHVASWSRSEHGYAHESLGTRYSNGLDISYGLTAANNDTRVKLTSGEIHDEDISFYLTHSATPTAIGEQILGSAGTADANFAALPIYYLSGATPVWRKTTTSSYPFLPASNNYIYYNRNNAGTWDYTTSIGSLSWVVYWIVATTNQSEPVVVIPGRQNNTNLTAAQAEGFPVLSGLFTEFKLLYRVIYKTSAANSNNGKCLIISVTDYRRDALANNASVSAATSAALIAFTPHKWILGTNVQSAIEQVVDKGTLFQRNLTADLSLEDGASLVVADYVDAGAYSITLAGDAVLMIIGGNVGIDRAGTAVSSATPSINTDIYDSYELTAQAGDITSMTSGLSGTPTRNQTLHVVITGTAARAITWGASFEGDLPTTTVTTKRMDVMLCWNVATSKWNGLTWKSAP